MKKFGLKLMAAGLIGAMAFSMVGCSQESKSSKNKKNQDRDVEISESELEIIEETRASLPEDWDFETEEIFGFINDGGMSFVSYEPALDGEPYTAEIVYSDGETFVYTGEYKSLVSSTTNSDGKAPAAAVKWNTGKASAFLDDIVTYTVTVKLDNYDYAWIYDSTQNDIQVVKN